MTLLAQAMIVLLSCLIVGSSLAVLEHVRYALLEPNLADTTQRAEPSRASYIIFLYALGMTAPAAVLSAVFDALHWPIVLLLIPAVFARFRVEMALLSDGRTSPSMWRVAWFVLLAIACLIPLVGVIARAIIGSH